MARIVIELSAREYETLKQVAAQNKRTPKAQAEWELAETLAEWERVMDAPPVLEMVSVKPERLSGMLAANEIRVSQSSPEDLSDHA